MFRIGTRDLLATIPTFPHCPILSGWTPVLNCNDLIIKSLGPCRIDSPMGRLLDGRVPSYHNVDESDRVLFDDTASALTARGRFRRGTPRVRAGGGAAEDLLRPIEDAAGIVTCGGLCPGFNDVIRSIVMELTFHYGVRRSTASAMGTRDSSPSTAGTSSS